MMHEYGQDQIPGFDQFAKILTNLTISKNGKKFTYKDKNDEKEKIANIFAEGPKQAKLKIKKMSEDEILLAKNILTQYNFQFNEQTSDFRSKLPTKIIFKEKTPSFLTFWEEIPKATVEEAKKLIGIDSEFLSKVFFEIQDEEVKIKKLLSLDIINKNSQDKDGKYVFFKDNLISRHIKNYETTMKEMEE